MFHKKHKPIVTFILTLDVVRLVVIPEQDNPVITYQLLEDSVGVKLNVVESAWTVFTIFDPA